MKTPKTKKKIFCYAKNLFFVKIYTKTTKSCKIFVSLNYLSVLVFLTLLKNATIMKHTATLILALILSISTLSAQTIKHIGTQYIKNYLPEDYNSSKQNWCAVQDFRGLLYIANTQGILEYDGVSWRTISTSKNSSALALALSNDGRRVYVGGNSDIGYLSPDSSGTMEYVSLLNLIPEKFRGKPSGTVIRIPTMV